MRIRTPIENRNGSLIGEMTIEEDGTFSGRFDPSTPIKDVLGGLASVGMVHGLILVPKMIPVEQE